MKFTDIVAGAFAVLAVVAIVFLVLMLMAGKTEANAGFWEYNEIADEFTNNYERRLIYHGGDQGYMMGCHFSKDGQVYYFTTIHFGQFVFLNSGGAPDLLKVKYGDGDIFEGIGWQVWESDSGMVSKYYWSYQDFKKAVENLENAGQVAYRVTAFGGKTHTIFIPAVQDAGKIDQLHNSCAP